MVLRASARRQTLPAAPRLTVVPRPKLCLESQAVEGERLQSSFARLRRASARTPSGPFRSAVVLGFAADCWHGIFCAMGQVDSSQSWSMGWAWRGFSLSVPSLGCHPGEWQPRDGTPKRPQPTNRQYVFNQEQNLAVPQQKATPSPSVQKASPCGGLF